jgi:hypothetical protein
MTKEFKVKRKDLANKLNTTITKKLRTLMHCYAIREFAFDPDNRFNFTFKMTYRKNGIVFKPSVDRVLKGSFEALEIEGDAVNLRLRITYEGCV